jgi:hypothetical protein
VHQFTQKLAHSGKKISPGLAPGSEKEMLYLPCSSLACVTTFKYTHGTCPESVLRSEQRETFFAWGETSKREITHHSDPLLFSSSYFGIHHFSLIGHARKCACSGADHLVLQNFFLLRVKLLIRKSRVTATRARQLVFGPRNLAYVTLGMALLPRPKRLWLGGYNISPKNRHDPDGIHVRG